MARRLASLLALGGLALSLVSAASAAFPAPFAVQGGTGLANLDNSMRYVAFKDGANTRLAALGQGGDTVMTRSLRGAFGIATLTQNGLAGGLFHDGSAFVLQNVGISNSSRFM